jgi:hypothetical protein
MPAAAKPVKKPEEKRALCHRDSMDDFYDEVLGKPDDDNPHGQFENDLGSTPRLRPSQYELVEAGIALVIVIAVVIIFGRSPAFLLASGYLLKLGLQTVRPTSRLRTLELPHWLHNKYEYTVRYNPDTKLWEIIPF